MREAGPARGGQTLLPAGHLLGTHGAPGIELGEEGGPHRVEARALGRRHGESRLVAESHARVALHTVHERWWNARSPLGARSCS